jgi:hypothetical protein
LLEKLTLAPHEIDSRDLAALRAAGVSDRAILDAAYVCVGFNIITRIANALGFQTPDDEVFSRASRLLMIFGYRRLSGYWTRGGYHRRAMLILKKGRRPRQPERETFDPHHQKLALLRRAVLTGPGSLRPAVRQAICDGHPVPGPLGSYANKVAEHSYAISDADIAELHEARYTDDQIFEATVSAALGAAILRLDCILHALRLAEIKPADFERREVVQEIIERSPLPSNSALDITR